MRYNSTIQPPPQGRECRHATCGSTCRREKKEPKPRKPIAKVSAKRKAGWFDKDAEEVTETPKESLWEWFCRQRSRMTGLCSHCGGKSQKNDDATFHYSICHILEKSAFPSIAQNDDVWIELCYYGNSCHANLDRKMLPISQLNNFDEVVTKFQKLYPFIAKEERRRIPAILMQYLNTDG